MLALVASKVQSGPAVEAEGSLIICPSLRSRLPSKAALNGRRLCQAKFMCFPAPGACLHLSMNCSMESFGEAFTVKLSVSKQPVMPEKVILIVIVHSPSLERGM